MDGRGIGWNEFWVLEDGSMDSKYGGIFSQQVTTHNVSFFGCSYEKKNSQGKNPSCLQLRLQTGTSTCNQEGRGFESHSVRMPLDKAFYPQLSLSTQV